MPGTGEKRARDVKTASGKAEDRQQSAAGWGRRVHRAGGLDAFGDWGMMCGAMVLKAG